MHVERLPRRLWYRWTEGGTETEYPTDIPTPIPEIKCDEVQVEVPPSVPGDFSFYVSQPNLPGQQTGASNYLLANFYSWQVPVYFMYPRFSGDPYCGLRITTYNWLGQPSNYDGVAGRAYTCGSLYMTPGNTLKPRRDLLIGSDRIINPTVNTPCPKWRFTGGNCPPNSLDCGNCCLDCAAVVAGIEGVTATVKGIVGR
jgi:hypothetical protein